MKPRPWLRLCQDGRYRLVILIGSLAIKLPRYSLFADGRRQNVRERARSQTDPAYCRVRACLFGGMVMVAERADAIGKKEYARLDAAGEIDELRNRRPENGRPYSICHEPNGRNIGRHRDGRLVILDYGDEWEGT